MMKREDVSKWFVATIVSIVTFVGCSDASTAPEAAFAQRLVGSYERVSTVPAPDGSTAYLRVSLTIEASESPTTVIQSLTTEAFFDEALTQRVLEYESVGPCEVVGQSSIPGGFEVDCTNTSSVLTVFETDPALIEGLGFEDCGLTAGVPRDVSDGCAAPTFIVSNCVDQDVFALSEDGGSFQWGDQSQNRCVRRSTELEPSAFDRIP
jgi:hypothetical protein